MNQKLSIIDEMHQTLKAHNQAFLDEMIPTIKVRRERLQRLKQVLLANKDAMVAAISEDFGHRSSTETELLELFPSLESIKHARKHLERWSRPKRQSTSIWFWPASTLLMKQPLGVVGIIVPWNYPLFLAVSPLVSALAAGNRVMIKMSEFTPRFSTLFSSIMEQAFPDGEVSVITGSAEVAQAFSELPFDHLFFTGSTQVGRKVMAAASKNLTPVTLELGGKSPTIVADDYAIDKACQSIIWGKLCNAGQTCIAPDYVYVPVNKLDEFIERAKYWINQYYPDWQGEDFSAIITGDHQARLQELLEDAKAKGAQVVSGIDDAPTLANQRLQPTLVAGVNDDMVIMQEEIFGPLLPIKTYHQLDEVIAEVNAGDRPLALYVFSNNKNTVNHVLTSTISGGVSVNDTLAHVAQEHLPFGGVGASGMGHCHGEYGFTTFTKLKPVFKQSRINFSHLIKPPYGKATKLLLKLMLR